MKAREGGSSRGLSATWNSRKDELCCDVPISRKSEAFRIPRLSATRISLLSSGQRRCLWVELPRPSAHALNYSKAPIAEPEGILALPRLWSGLHLSDSLPYILFLCMKGMYPEQVPVLTRMFQKEGAFPTWHLSKGGRGEASEIMFMG